LYTQLFLADKRNENCSVFLSLFTALEKPIFFLGICFPCDHFLRAVYTVVYRLEAGEIMRRTGEPIIHLFRNPVPDSFLEKESKTEM
jgi:hypothetical protein